MRLSLIFLFITLAGCEKLEYDSDEDSSEDSSEEASYIPHVETTLDFRGNIRKLFAVELGLEGREQNMICSPISAMILLAKLLLGASQKSESRKELLAALGLNNTYELTSSYKQTLNEIEFLRGVEISLIGRIYISKRFKLLSKFKKKSQNIFGSTIELIDVTKPDEVADIINDWVSQNTNNTIKTLVNRNDIAPHLSLLLVNAMYFKGFWKIPFRPARHSSFYSPSGTITVPMMSITGSFNYFQCDNLNAQIIELPYKGEESAMIIVLPNAKNGLPILLRTLKVSYDLLNTALMKMKTAEVDVTIPKFKIETTIDLRSYYGKMGVLHSLVQERSGLNQIVKRHTVHISNAVQRAIIEVTETGTVAAAVSVVQLIAKMGPIEFRANRPFLFYIRAGHEQLFAGVVYQPSFDFGSK